LAKKKNKQNSFVFGLLIIAGLGIVVFTLTDIEFTGIPLSLIQERDCDINTVGAFGVRVSNNPTCDFRVSGSGNYDDFDFPIIASLPLATVDTKSPMPLTFTSSPNLRPFDPAIVGTVQNPECEAFFTDNLTLTLTDENGITLATIFSTPRLTNTLTDIQPLLLPNQQTLFTEITGGICPTGNLQYEGSSVMLYLQKPPEITEFKNPLLQQWLFLADLTSTGVVELSTSFAIAESFELVDPTVITELRVRYSSNLPYDQQDFDTAITAFVWNLNESPPKRIVQSAETITGFRIGSPGGAGAQIEDAIDLDFTFPKAVALLPNSTNGVPITYAVGIKVTQNPGQEFIYSKGKTNFALFPNDQIADTHKCVIDKTLSPDGETNFVDNGICGFDIFHNQLKAVSILDVTQGIQGIQGEVGATPDPLTQAELIVILCEGISPEPEICQTGLQLTANSCGVTEVFFNGQCICGPNFDRNAAGNCQIREDKSPDLLKIGGFTESELAAIGIGLLILIFGSIGFLALRRR